MQLSKIIDTSTIQAYRILSPSTKFKKRFPKKFTFVFFINGRIINGNENAIPLIVKLPIVRGYIFTYAEKMPQLGFNLPVDIDNSTYPECLDQYFGKEGIDLVVKCKPKTSHIVPPSFTSDVIIRMNSKDLLGAKSMSSSIMSILNEHLNSFKTTEDFFNFVINECPMDNEMNPISFPKRISNNSLSGTVKKSDVFITYDYRPTNVNEKSYDVENELITKLEDAFEPPNLKLTITDSYNGLSGRIKKELDKQRLAYKYNSSDKSITVSLRNLRKINMTYDLIDFI